MTQMHTHSLNHSRGINSDSRTFLLIKPIKELDNSLNQWWVLTHINELWIQSLNDTTKPWLIAASVLKFSNNHLIKSNSHNTHTGDSTKEYSLTVEKSTHTQHANWKLVNVSLQFRQLNLIHTKQYLLSLEMSSLVAVMWSVLREWHQTTWKQERCIHMNFTCLNLSPDWKWN